MTQTTKQPTFEEYLNLDTEDWLRRGLPEDGRWEYVDGNLNEVPSESELNDWIAMVLRDIFVEHISRRLVKVGRCEIEVSGNPRTRYPDLVILREEHLSLTQRRLLVTLTMSAPQLVVEVVSPGDTNRERDYQQKRQQYQQRGIPEYWLIDPDRQVVIVLELREGKYTEVGTFQGTDCIESPTFPQLQLTAQEVLSAQETAP